MTISTTVARFRQRQGLLWRLLLATLALGALLLDAAGARAAGGGAETITTPWVETVVDRDPVPCTGAPAARTRSYDGQIHSTTRPDGSQLITVLAKATVSYAPDDPAALDMTGEYVVRGTIIVAGGSATERFNLNLRGTFGDGSKASYHAVEHLTVSADGKVIAFAHVTDSCERR